MTKPRVYLFGTCLVDMFYPEAGMDAIALLEKCGYEVVYPQAQTCCGQPPYNSGDSAAALAIAQQTIDLFDDDSLPVIVPSASCAGMIKHHYPKLLRYDRRYQPKAENLANRTYELIDFVLDKLPWETLEARSTKPITLSFHPSCAAQREMKVASRWYDALSKLPNVDVVLPNRAHECCGFGGTFAVKSPDISAVMTNDKAEALLAASPNCITSGDCGCLININGHLEKSGHDTPCLPISRLLAEAFGIQYEH